jgi:hypothetical protein
MQNKLHTEQNIHAPSITAGSQGYNQNAFATLGEDSEDNDDNVQTVIMQMVAVTMQSQLAATTTVETQALVTTAINQLSANQQVMQQQIAAIQKQFAVFITQCNTTYQARTPPPPITQFTIPNFAAFPPKVRGGGQRGGRGWGGRSNFATTEGRNVHMPFANFTEQGSQDGLPPVGRGESIGGGMTSFAQQTPARNATPMYSNIVKRYANWNICFLCGFDMEDGHTSKTCPWQLRHANHQGGGG